MPLRAHSLGLAYFPVPKNACTSLKLWWHEAVTGAPFVAAPAGAGQPRHIHQVPGYAAGRFHPRMLDTTAHLERLVVLRHPVRRLISAYTNRVVRHRELSLRAVAAERFAAAGLSPDPDIHAFAEALAGYRALSPSIAHHTHPQGWFLGPSVEAYHHVFRMEELPTLAEFLQARLGRPLPLPHEQRTLRPLGPVAPATLRRLEAHCADELHQLARWYPDARLDQAA